MHVCYAESRKGEDRMLCGHGVGVSMGGDEDTAGMVCVYGHMVGDVRVQQVCVYVCGHRVDSS